MALLLLYLFLALGVSFVCSILEAVLLSITPSYIAVMQKEGGTVGERLEALQLPEDVLRVDGTASPEDLVAAIQERLAQG